MRWPGGRGVGGAAGRHRGLHGDPDRFGRDYAAARPRWAVAAQSAPAEPSAALRGGIERAVFEAANAEPLLRVPARIGMVRVHRGALTAVPPAEAGARRGGTWMPCSPPRSRRAGATARRSFRCPA